ncbi:MAG: EamA family transporter [Clostridia bacterium]|nr:EamA family transporter [Clostridia bacterium]
MKTQTRAKLLLALSMAIFGTLAPFVRNIPLTSAERALWRAVLAIVLIGGFLLVTRQRLPLRSIQKALPLLLLSGMAMGINWILLFEAYNYTTVSVATLSYYFAPVLVTVLCPLLFRERMTKKQLFCFLMSTLGLVLVIGVGDLSGSNNHLIGILFGLGAAVLYATVILINKKIEGVEGIPRTFIQFIAAVLILVPYVLIEGGNGLGSMNTKGWICLLVIGFVHTGLTYCMYFSSIKEMTGQNIAILSYLDPLVAILISVFVLQEAITPLQIVGGVMILGFTLYNEIGFTKKKGNNHETNV